MLPVAGSPLGRTKPVVLVVPGRSESPSDLVLVVPCGGRVCPCFPRMVSWTV